MPKAKTNRGIISYFFLTIFTLGIYPFYYVHKLAKELNLALTEEDCKKTSGLFALIFFSIITVGIYGIVWWCNVASRLGNFYARRSLDPRITCGSFICWNIFGVLLFGLGPIIAFAKIMHAHNDVNRDYLSRFSYV